VETILVATDRLFASTGDAAEMVRQARVLGQATAQLIQAIKVMVLVAVQRAIVADQVEPHTLAQAVMFLACLWDMPC
jgi:hypothetical protein